MKIMKSAEFMDLCGPHVERQFIEFYAGRMPRPCDDDCPRNCDGEHNYEIIADFTPIFGITEEG